jgi:ATP-dependent exoDNAse (exonuclease V) beta subunit
MSITGSGNLVDREARRRIGNDLSASLSVDAGAGSGKTTSLIDRIVSLVSDGGLPMGSIAAITFTEAAAAELRLRVRRTLTDRAQRDPRLLVPARDVDDAAICTIHAFALRVLSEYWLEIGLPPNVEVLDAASEHLDHRTRWRQFAADLLEDPGAAPTMVRALAAGLRLRDLSKVAHAMADHHDRITPEVLTRLAQEHRDTADPSVNVRAIVGHLERAAAGLPRCTNDTDNLCVHLLTTVIPALRRLRPLVDSADEATVISVLSDLGKLSSSGGQKSNWTIDIADVRDACRAAEDARADTLRGVRESVVNDLGWRIAGWTLNCAEARREEGRFTFHDLLVESCRVLRTNQEVRRAVRDRYRCLLIDEFQDTDPLQAELAHLLADDPGQHDEAARLFVVGDPEQSIYRFRRADVAQFEATVTKMDERLALTSNFRSVPEVLTFVDAVFARLAPGPGAPSVAHRSLHPVRSANPASSGPPVAVFGGPDSEGAARDVRFRSTAEVASVVRSIVRDEWLVETESVDTESVGTESVDTEWIETDLAETKTALRPTTFGDIAVLLPTRTALPMLERAFDDADIPYRLEGSTLVWASQDVRDLLAVVRAVDDPADPVAVVAALRTPALACGDDDLLRYHAAGGLWDPRAPAPEALEAGDPVVNAMATLADLHGRRMWIEPSALVSRIVTDLHFFELALVHRRPRDHWQRLRWVIDQVRAFDETDGVTLGDFLEWVDLSEEAERWSSSLGPPESDDDAVRVMTVHGAKGLEFPVVLLTGLDSPPSNIAPSLIFDDVGIPRFRFSVDFRSPTHEALASNEAALDKAERFRLLYVALTRARDHLVVDLNHKEASREALAAILYPACQEIGEGLQRLTPEVTAARLLARPADTGVTTTGDWWSSQQRWREQRGHTLASAARQPAWSATALSKEAADGRRSGADPAAHLVSGPGTDPETGRRIGRAVHDALAKIELPSTGILTDDAAGIAAGAARAQHLEEAGVALVVALVRSAVGSPLLRSIAAGRHWKELPLAAPLPAADGAHEGGVIEGFADLVGESSAGLVVVDFKTAAGRSSSRQYLWQVALYAYALGAATGRRVDRVVVTYLGTEGTEEESLAGAELDAAIDQVLATARSAGVLSRPR